MDQQFAVKRSQEMFGLLILNDTNFFGTTARTGYSKKKALALHTGNSVKWLPFFNSLSISMVNKAEVPRSKLGESRPCQK